MGAGSAAAEAAAADGAGAGAAKDARGAEVPPPPKNAAISGCCLLGLLFAGERAFDGGS